MFFFYSFLYTVGILLMSPLFLLRRQKYASGFRERLGEYPEFKQDERNVIWLHCVSVGETNAARPLVDELIKSFPNHRLVISTTTRTGQELAKKIFADKTDAIFYCPYDWKFSVRRALQTFRPSLLLLMETEIWPRLIAEAKISGTKVAIVNGRLSEKSYNNYSRVSPLIRRVLNDVDVALMQGDKDAKRIKALGFDEAKIIVTGNLKFDLSTTAEEDAFTEEFRERFAIDDSRPIIVAASTHEPEEKIVLDALVEMYFHIPNYQTQRKPRLLIAPRHPERFNEVANLISTYASISFSRRSASKSESDKASDVILLDSIGELRNVYPLAEIVFVGGSLIPHGGQSVLEPAAAGKAIITGHFTYNFEQVVAEMVTRKAIVQLPIVLWEDGPWPEYAASESEKLSVYFLDLLWDENERQELGRNAAEVIAANRGATAKTVSHLKALNNEK
jgi:3-deoxy-D-manno-octulosonic-acid transferase